MYKYTSVNAFARKPFHGEPVVVFVLPETWDDEDCALVSKEGFAPVTAFVVPKGDSRTVYDTKYFANGCEIKKSTGGALAVAHVLWTEGRAGHGESIILSTGETVVKVQKRADHIVVSGETRNTHEANVIPATIAAIPHKCFVGEASSSLVVELETVSAVRGLSLANQDMSVIVTAKSDRPESHYIFRLYPGVSKPIGMGEVAEILGPYWANRFHESVLTGESVAERGGFVHTESSLNSEILVSGQASTVAKGILLKHP